MRFYEIGFQTEDGTAFPKNIESFQKVSSVFKKEGQTSSQEYNNGGALEVEFQIESGAIDQNIPNGFIRVYNPPMNIIDNASSFYGLVVTIYAGFNDSSYSGFKNIVNQQTNAANKGVNTYLGQGKVFMSFANYVGGDWALDMYIGPVVSSGAIMSQNSNSTSYSFQWITQESIDRLFYSGGYSGSPPPAKTLYAALLNSFITVDSEGKTTSQIKNVKFDKSAEQYSSLKPQKDYSWNNSSLQQFGEQFRSMTSELIEGGPGPYLNGLSLVILGGVIYVVNKNAEPSNVYQINSDFLIGQPTISYNGGALEIQTVHPLDANIKPDGMGIKISDANNRLFVTASNKTYNEYKNLNLVGQSLKVQRVNHIGKFRDNSHQGWVTVVNSAYVPAMNTGK